MTNESTFNDSVALSAANAIKNADEAKKALECIEMAAQKTLVLATLGIETDDEDRKYMRFVTETGDKLKKFVDEFTDYARDVLNAADDSEGDDE